MMARASVSSLVAKLSALLLIVLLLSVISGPVPVDATRLWAGLSGSDAVAQTILLDIRLPRAAAAMIAGMALGAGGAAIQGLLRNPLADPGVMGISACAATAATGSVYFGLAAAMPWVVPLASTAGALFATFIVALAAIRLRGVASLILLGVALSSMAGAGMALFVNLAPNPFSLSDLINWTAGSVANRDWAAIGLSLPLVILGLILIALARRSLSALTLGEEAAHALGVDLKRNRLLVVLGTGIATGGAVAIAGIVGFVGLVAPHMVRGAVNHDAGVLILPSALVGGLLLVVADMLIRLFPWGNELHLGTLAALIGAPVFALIALRVGTVRHG
jgi:iron complex transport system permease protein